MSLHSQPRVLIAGIGNIFHGDDAFGVELAQRLLQRTQAESVKVVDFGIRSFDLAYALLDEPDVAILLDATKRGSAPGTLYTIEIDVNQTDRASGSVDAHSMNPMHVLELVRKLGGTRSRVLLVGCEPLTFGTEEEGAFGLSDVVLKSVDRGVDVVEELLREVSQDFKKGVTACQELT